jgi:hypothetical protein
MAGYVVIWAFFLFIGLLFLATVIGYYSARFYVWLVDYWNGK